MSTAIHVEGLSKYYRLGVINHGMLYKDIQSRLARRLGRPDPHAQVGTEHFADQTEGFWALKDLNFDIHQGDRVGIIGKNGAGKSTLLKILSRITAPTEGLIKIKGRVTSLLEVGTGFHGELTGRENIYLNGAILGMKKRDIDRKIDEIIDFSEIEQHIDTPVKRYSSGMYVRLAFAVAAHLDSEILIADEVLAVGDAAFQKKAIGKMRDLSTGQGRTVLFVSHNMGAVKQLCLKGMILDRGMILRKSDDILIAVNSYLHGDASESETDFEWHNDGLLSIPEFTPERMLFLESDGTPVKLPVLAEKEYLLELEYTIQEACPSLTFGFSFYTEDDVVAFTTSPIISIEDYAPHPGRNRVRCLIERNLLNDKKYRVELQASLFQNKWLLEPGKTAPFLYFQVDKRKTYSPFSGTNPGQLAPFLKWSVE